MSKGNGGNNIICVNAADGSSVTFAAFDPMSQLPDAQHSSSASVKTLRLQGPSPDEVALAEGARQLGFEFVSRSSNGVVLNLQGTEVRCAAHASPQ